METKNRVRDRLTDVTAGTWQVAARPPNAARDGGHTGCASPHVLLLSQPRRPRGRGRDAAGEQEVPSPGLKMPKVNLELEETEGLGVGSSQRI